MPGTLRFFFDFVSPYSYLAWTRIHTLAERHGRAVDPVPIVLGAVLQANGARPAVEMPNRRAYMKRDLVRIAHLYGVPIAPPPVHPFNPLLALRLASLPMPGTPPRALIDALYASVWGRREGANDRAILARLAAAAGLPGDALEAAESPENKLRLRAQTEEAVALGVFGVPTTEADGELFFGNDGLPHLERFLS